MSEFETCLRRRGLVRFEGDRADAAAREMESARGDLTDVAIMLEHGQWKRVTITSYYAMFHAARALSLQNGYAEKSHFCLGVAFRHFYGDTLEGRELAMGLERARVLREDADYRALFDEVGARAATVVAERFVSFASTKLG
jgi:uncharacterized protein (UPF0332 family)